MRRASTVLSTILLAAVAAAQTDLRQVVRSAEDAGVTTGVAVRDVDGRESWFSHRADELLIPASNQKILTVAGALHELGAGYEFATGFEVRGGTLVVHGGGDPNWVARSPHAPERMLSEVAHRLRRVGIEVLRGIDCRVGAFTGPTRPEGWPRNQLDRWYCAPSAGLVLEAGCYELSIEPSDARAALVELVSPPGAFVVEGALDMTSSKRKGSLYHVQQRNGTLRLSGGYWKGANGRALRMAVDDPVATFERSLRTVLAAHGIGFDDRARGELDRFELRTPLRAALGPILADSSNAHAEQLLRVLGAESLGDGSFAGGRAALREALSQLVGELPSRLEIADGSGLARANRVSAAFLVELLEAVLRSEDGPLFAESLAHGGIGGTLSKRFTDGAIRGRVRGKTGTINRVSALSGVIKDGSGRVHAFSILMNARRGAKVSASTMRRWQDRIVTAIHDRP